MQIVERSTLLQVFLNFRSGSLVCSAFRIPCFLAIQAALTTSPHGGEREKERERTLSIKRGWSERTTLRHVHYHMWNRSPVQVRCMRQGAQGRCTGMTLWVGMGWVVGGGSGWGTHVHPWLIHVHVWQKPPQYCKVISLQFKKNKKNIPLSE